MSARTKNPAFSGCPPVGRDARRTGEVRHRAPCGKRAPRASSSQARTFCHSNEHPATDADPQRAAPDKTSKVRSAATRDEGLDPGAPPKWTRPWQTPVVIRLPGRGADCRGEERRLADRVIPLPSSNQTPRPGCVATRRSRWPLPTAPAAGVSCPAAGPPPPPSRSPRPPPHRIRQW